VTTHAISRLGDSQLSVLEVYCFDPAHEDAFPGWVEGATLYFEHADMESVFSWLMDVANGLDDSPHPEDQPWAQAAERLAMRVLSAPVAKGRRR
jgi:hypothetical protein